MAMLNSLSMNVRRIRSVGVAAILAAASLLAAPSTSSAQFGMMGMGGEMGDMMKPAVSSRMLKQYGDILALSAGQKSGAEELLAAYQNDFRDATTRLEEVFTAIQEEAQDSGEWELYQDAMPSAMMKFVKKTETLNKSLLDDLKTLLDAGQQARFPAFERALRRKSSFKMGFEGTQKMDLSETISNMGLDAGATTAVAGTLDQYEVELDGILVTHDKMAREFMEEMMKDMEDGKKPQEDPEKMMKMMKEFGESAKKIGEVNDKYARQIQPQLPEAEQKEFEYQIKLAKYPQVYKKSMATRIIDAVEKMSDLDAGQKEGLRGLKEGYARDAESANTKWTQVIDEVKGSMGDEMGFGGGVWMLRQNEKYQESQNARKALDTKTIDAVKALLNEDQKKKMPNALKRPEFDFDAPLGTR